MYTYALSWGFGHCGWTRKSEAVVCHSVVGHAVRKYEQFRASPGSAMTSHLSIRPAVGADLDALLHLERSSFTTDHLSRAQYRRHIDSSSAAVLVAVDAHVVLGNAVIFFRSNSISARLYSIAVSHAARGRGLGDLLADAAEATARRRGCARITLEVRTDNHGAIRLYARRGYVRFGAVAEFYEDGADAWRYKKIL